MIGSWDEPATRIYREFFETRRDTEISERRKTYLQRISVCSFPQEKDTINGNEHKTTEEYICDTLPPMISSNAFSDGYFVGQRMAWVGMILGTAYVILEKR